MTKDEALRLALDALEPIPYKDDWTVAKETNKAITAIKAALEAKDEPVAWNAGIPSLYPKMKEGETISVEYVELTPLQQDGECKHCSDGCPACDTRKLPKQEPVQVSPLEFVEMVMEKEHLVGKPIFWAEWPNKEKNT
jgi:hypothetical protein